MYIPIHKMKNYLTKNLVEIETQILKSLFIGPDGNFVFLDNEDFEKKQKFS